MTAFAEDTDLAISLRNLRRVETLSSVLQRIELFRHPLLGRILTINGEIQHIERWQALYHEPLVHVPAAFVPEIRRVLILGGGSLFAAAEALRYPTVERCLLVDHDPSVLDLMSRHYDHANIVLNDARFEYHPDDAITFLLETGDCFDLIINDCFDIIVVSGATGLPIFDLMSGKLSSDGVCSDLIYRHIFEQNHLQKTKLALQSNSSFGLSLVAVPDYPGMLHVLTFWGGNSISQDIRRPLNGVQKMWCRTKKSPDFQFFNPAFLPFHLYLPPYLTKLWTELSDKGPTKTKIV